MESLSLFDKLPTVKAYVTKGSIAEHGTCGKIVKEVMRISEEQGEREEGGDGGWRALLTFYDGNIPYDNNSYDMRPALRRQAQ